MCIRDSRYNEHASEMLGNFINFSFISPRYHCYLSNSSWNALKNSEIKKFLTWKTKRMCLTLNPIKFLSKCIKTLVITDLCREFLPGQKCFFANCYRMWHVCVESQNFPQEICSEFTLPMRVQTALVVYCEPNWIRGEIALEKWYKWQWHDTHEFCEQMSLIKSNPFSK